MNSGKTPVVWGRPRVEEMAVRTGGVVRMFSTSLVRRGSGDYLRQCRTDVHGPESPTGPEGVRPILRRHYLPGSPCPTGSGGKTRTTLDTSFEYRS